MEILNVQKFTHIQVTTDDKEYKYMRSLDWGGENDWEILKGGEWVDSLTSWPDLEKIVKEWDPKKSMYKRNEILESVLFRRGVFKLLEKTPDQVKSLRANFKKGVLKESTAREILAKAGFHVVQEEMWDCIPAKPVHR